MKNLHKFDTVCHLTYTQRVTEENKIFLFFISLILYMDLISIIAFLNSF